MRFFKALYNSLWNLPWLKAQRATRAWAWGYFSLFILLVTLALIVPFALIVPSAIKELKTKVEQLPAFESGLKGGVLTVSGITQPFVDKQGDMVLVIDTVSTGTVALGQYKDASVKTVLAVTKDSLLISDNGREQTVEFKNIPDFAGSKNGLADSINRYTKPQVVALALLLLTVFLYVVAFISKILVIEVVALLVFLAASIGGKGWKFGELAKVGMFATTLPTIIAFVLTMVGFQIVGINFLALLAFMLAIVFTKDGTEPVDNSTKKV